MVKIENLKDGDIVNYGYYSNVFFKGLDEHKIHVKLKDKNGHNKLIYIDLFEKYGSKVDES